MHTEYIPTDDFVKVAKERIEAGETKTLTNVDGSARWVMTRTDGTQYILRPE